jgi:hypothetical protein
MDSTTLVGVLGAGLLLAAFGAEKFKKLSNDSFSYDFLNLFGAGLLTWYAVLLSSTPFIILEGIWTLVALQGIIKRALKKKAEE